MRKSLALLALAAACGNPDNYVIGGAQGPNTPPVLLASINSAISGPVHLTDPTGHQTGEMAGVIILSDKPGLCDALHANPSYFRNPVEAFQALILFVPIVPLRLGTFVIGRTNDEGTGSEILVAAGRQASITPFTASSGGDIELTVWQTGPGGHAQGSFGSFQPLFFTYPGDPILFPFYGGYVTDVCTTLDGVLLP